MTRLRTWGPLWAIAIGLVVALGSPLTAEAQAQPKAKAPAAAPAATKPVDVNAATQEELEKLPGVGEATAKKIIAGRPYASMDDLTKKLTDAKVSKSTISKITPLVTVGASAGAGAATGAAAKPAPTTPAPGPAPAAAKSGETAKSPAAATTAQTPPQKGMVWANTDSKIYHKEGDRWYGKTKQGKWMTEADALKEGYRAAKN